MEERIHPDILARIRNAGYLDRDTLVDNYCQIHLLGMEKLKAGVLIGDICKREIGYYSFLHKTDQGYLVPEPIRKERFSLMVDYIQTASENESTVVCQYDGQPFKMLFSEEIKGRQQFHFLVRSLFSTVKIFFEGGVPCILIQSHQLYRFSDYQMQWNSRTEWDSNLIDFNERWDAPFEQFVEAATVATANLNGFEIAYSA